MGALAQHLHSHVPKAKPLVRSHLLRLGEIARRLSRPSQ